MASEEEKKRRQSAAAATEAGESVNESLRALGETYQKPSAYTGNRKLYDSPRAKVSAKTEVILSRTVDKFLTRERMLKNLQQWSHRTVDVSPSEEAHRLLNKSGGCSNSS